MRGGLAIAKPAGGLAGGADSTNLTIVLPEVPLETVIDWMRAFFMLRRWMRISASLRARAASIRATS